jgi:hypothetical protein
MESGSTMRRVENQQRFSVEEYLAFEDGQESRHECVGGVVLELPGASVAHNLVKDNVIDAMRRHLRAGPLRVYATAMKLRVGEAFLLPRHHGCLAREPGRPLPHQAPSHLRDRLTGH